MRKTAILCIVICLTVPCTAATITVNWDGTGDHTTIQAAINDANDLDTVIVADGTYTGAGNRDIDFLGKAITVRSEKGPENCIIDCDSTYEEHYRGFYFHNGEGANSILEGVTITRGYLLGCGMPEDGGAGICCYNSSPTISNCIITDNGTSLIPGCLGFCFGGGIKISGNSSPIFTNCIISNNSVGSFGYGGGIYCGYPSTLTMVNCTIADNFSAHSGGGICCESWGGSGSIIINCILTRNEALEEGAAILAGGDAKIINCTIVGNKISEYSFVAGAAIFADGNTKIINCTIVGNETVGYLGQAGPAILADEDAKIINCTIVGNNTVGYDGQEAPAVSLSGDSMIVNSIVWDNLPNQNQLLAASGMAIYNNIQNGWLGTGNIDVDPCFADPCNGDYHLKSTAGRWDPNQIIWVYDDVTSPCIDAGNPGCPIADEPNDIANVRINMGAYGGTTQASRTPAGWGLLCDVNNDFSVNTGDLNLFAQYWLYSGECIPADFSRSQGVNWLDFGYLYIEWLGVRQIFEPGLEYQIQECDQGAMASAAALDDLRFTVTVEGNNILFEDMMVANCCPDELWLEMTVNGNTITIYERELTTHPCKCICDYPVSAAFGPFNPGTYTIEVYEDFGGFIGTTTVIID